MITLTMKTITVIHPATTIAIIIIDMTTIITSKTITIIAIQPLVYIINYHCYNKTILLYLSCLSVATSTMALWENPLKVAENRLLSEAWRVPGASELAVSLRFITGTIPFYGDTMAYLYIVANIYDIYICIYIYIYIYIEYYIYILS